MHMHPKPMKNVPPELAAVLPMNETGLSRLREMLGPSKLWLREPEPTL